MGMYLLYNELELRVSFIQWDMLWGHSENNF